MSKKFIVGIPGWLMYGCGIAMVLVGNYDLAVFSMLAAIYLRVIFLRLED